jgi:hypothetical protein
MVINPDTIVIRFIFFCFGVDLEFEGVVILLPRFDGYAWQTCSEALLGTNGIDIKRRSFVGSFIV